MRCVSWLTLLYVLSACAVEQEGVAAEQDTEALVPNPWRGLDESRCDAALSALEQEPNFASEIAELGSVITEDGQTGRYLLCSKIAQSLQATSISLATATGPAGAGAIGKLVVLVLAGVALVSLITVSAPLIRNLLGKMLFDSSIRGQSEIDAEQFQIAFAQLVATPDEELFQNKKTPWVTLFLSTLGITIKHPIRFDVAT